MATDVDLVRRVRRTALENAVAHGAAPKSSSILSRLLGSDPTLRSRASELRGIVDEVISEVERLSLNERKAELERLGGPEAVRVRESRSAGELPPLDGAENGSVVLRMAPFPSGALHIGNARMLFVNDFYRRQYDGRLLLVFDDTIGSEEKRVDPEMFGRIEADLKACDVPVDATYYKSDRVPNFYPWAERVIRKDAAYVCVCPAETLRENRRTGTACPERLESADITLEKFAGMLSGEYAPGEAVLRLKTDLSDPDPAFRDRVMMRISDLDHPRVGRKYRVWPMLEFSWAVDDVELGVTHVVRGKDLVIEDRMEEFIWRLLGIHGPRFVHWGLLRIREAKLSKSKSYAEVKSGEFDGWTDPRTWSIGSLVRRGISVDAIREFTLSFGLSLADIEVPAETLYAENRKRIDATTARRHVVFDPVRVIIDGYPKALERVALPNHPDRPELGLREVAAGPEFFLARADVDGHLGSEIRLKDLVNVELPATVPTDGPLTARFTSVENKRLPRVQWVGVTGAARVDLLDPDGRHRQGIGEGALTSAHPAERYQFERIGFVRTDEGWTPGSSPIRAVYGHP